MIVRAVGVEGLAVTNMTHAAAEQATLRAGGTAREIGLHIVEIAEGG